MHTWHIYFLLKHKKRRPFLWKMCVWSTIQAILDSLFPSFETEMPSVSANLYRPTWACRMTFKSFHRQTRNTIRVKISTRFHWVFIFFSSFDLLLFYSTWFRLTKSWIERRIRRKTCQICRLSPFLPRCSTFLSSIVEFTGGPFFTTVFLFMSLSIVQTDDDNISVCRDVFCRPLTEEELLPAGEIK